MKHSTKIKFLKTGLLTSIQDQGRQGYQQHGMPCAGAMDCQSARTANYLVGNAPDNPVFEITLLGPRIEIFGSCWIAMAGADLSPDLDGKPAPMYESIRIENRGVLSFGRQVNGCRTYLAVGGEWKLHPFLGSYSPLPGQGVIDDRIAQDAIIEVEALSEWACIKVGRMDFPGHISASVLPGPEFDWFSGYEMEQFFNKNFRIAPDSNRMGYRLLPLFHGYQPPRELISSGIVPGTIQITHSGQPVLLLADAQTTGGYARIANVVSSSLDKIGQLKPGDSIRFVLQK